MPPEAQAAAKAGREADKAAEAEAAAAKEAGGRSSGRTSGRTTPNRASERASGDDLEDPKAPPPSSEDASAEVTQSGPNYAYVVSTYRTRVIITLSFWYFYWHSYFLLFCMFRIQLQRTQWLFN